MYSVLRDTRLALRSLGRSPGFTIAASLTLALGLGCVTAIFAVAYPALLRPLPYPDDNRLTMLWETNAAQSKFHDGVAPANFVDWRSNNKMFEGLAAWYTQSVTCNQGGVYQEIIATTVTEDFFNVLGVNPTLGRTFSRDEYLGTSTSESTNTPPVAVLSHGFWKQQFGGDDQVVGTDVILNNELWTIIGVMPATFAIPDKRTDVWLPLDLALVDRTRDSSRDRRYLQVIGRLAIDKTMQEAQERMMSVAATLAEVYPKTNRNWNVKLTLLRDEILGGSRLTLWFLAAAVGATLLIACGNVVNLLLVRATHRQHATTVRTALGATRLDIARQPIIESILLAVTGGAGGLILANSWLYGLLTVFGHRIGRFEDVSLNWYVIGFAFCIALSVGLINGGIALVHMPSTSMVNVLSRRNESGSHVSERTGNLLVVLQTSLSLALLFGAGLSMQSYLTLRTANPGFRTGNLLISWVSLNPDSYSNSSQVISYFDQLIEALEGIPEVESAAIVTSVPMNKGDKDFDRPYSRVGENLPSAESPETHVRVASDRYFFTMEIPLLDGRTFDSLDQINARRVIIVNDTLAFRVWPAEKAVGQQLVIDYQGGPNTYEVVGVVADVSHWGFREAARPEVFVPHTQDPYRTMNVVVRTTRDPLSVSNAVHDASLRIDSAQPLRRTATMTQLLNNQLAMDTLSVIVLATIAALAVVIATIGIYGIVSYSVARRAREIGVRIALGARRQDVLRLVVGRTMASVTIGIVIGFAISMSFTGVFSAMLYGVNPLSPITYLAVALLFVIISVAACLVPASRAMQLSPAIVMRAE